MPPIKASQALDWGRLPDSFEHHGIKGQHWGEKHGPPYPLKPEVSNRISKGEIDRDKGVYISPGAATMLAMMTIPPIISFIHKEKMKTMDNSKVKEVTKRRAHEQIDPETGLYLNNEKESIDDAYKKVNPLYGRGDEYENNCALCTIATAFRIKGYDVVAGNH